MRKFVRSLLISILAFFACKAAPENKDLKEQIKHAITSYVLESAQKNGERITIDSLTILDVDSLTKKEFALNASQRFKKLIYLCTKNVQSFQQDIEEYSKLAGEDKKNISDHDEQRLSQLHLLLDTAQADLRFSISSFDSCYRVSEEVDSDKFAGYLVTTYTDMVINDVVFNEQLQYLVTQNMQVRPFLNWDEFAKQLSDSGKIKPVLKTSTQD